MGGVWWAWLLMMSSIEVGVVMRLNEFLLKSNTDNINLFKVSVCIV